jgi:hypothetical protein
MEGEDVLRYLEQLDLVAFLKIRTMLEIRDTLIDGESLGVREVAERWNLTERTAQRYLRDLFDLEDGVLATPRGTGFSYSWVEPEEGKAP